MGTTSFYDVFFERERGDWNFSRRTLIKTSLNLLFRGGTRILLENRRKRWKGVEKFKARFGVFLRKRFPPSSGSVFWEGGGSDSANSLEALADGTSLLPVGRNLPKYPTESRRKMYSEAVG